jgi:hypothetical protein
LEPDGTAPAPSRAIDAPRKAIAPVLDGRIDLDEYGPDIDVRFDDEANPNLFHDAGVTPAPARSKASDDFSFRLHAAHTATTLYLAFEVRDQNVQTGSGVLYLYDSLELLLDGDRVPNDFDLIERKGNREGF